MRRTDAVAVRDRREALHVNVEQAPERLRLGDTQLRELRGDVGDGAMVLTQLLAHTERRDRRSVAVGAQRRGERLGAVVRGQAVNDGTVAPFDLGGASLRERCDSFFADRCGEVAQRGSGDVVVGVAELLVSSLGQREQLRGSTTTSRTTDGRLTGDDHPRGQQGVEVSANRRRRKAQLLAERCGGGGPGVEQDPHDPIPGARINVHRDGRRSQGFHKGHVT